MNELGIKNCQNRTKPNQSNSIGLGLKFDQNWSKSACEHHYIAPSIIVSNQSSDAPLSSFTNIVDSNHVSHYKPNTNKYNIIPHHQIYSSLLSQNQSPNTCEVSLFCCKSQVSTHLTDVKGEWNWSFKRETWKMKKFLFRLQKLRLHCSPPLQPSRENDEKDKSFSLSKILQ